MPAFGFSVGDLIAAIDVINRVAKALKKAGGASADYQHVQIELRALGTTLEHLRALQPNEWNAKHVNAIRGVALACQLPLLRFLQRLEKFESSMGPTASHKPLKGVLRKSGWELFMTEELAKLRMMISGKTISISLLLALQNSESLSRLESKVQDSQNSFRSVVEEHRSKLDTVQRHILAGHEASAKSAEQSINATKELISSSHKTSHDLEAISSQTAATNTSIMSLKGVATQLLKVMGGLPFEIREILRTVVASNLQMYGLLRSIQSNMNRSPVWQPQDCIHFEDVLGRSKILPYEYFRHFDLFEKFLKHQFSDPPGEEEVRNGQYLIMDARLQDSEIAPNEWSHAVLPGSRLHMSVLVDNILRIRDRCPRPGCSAPRATGLEAGPHVCTNCGLNSASASSVNHRSFQPSIDPRPEPTNASMRSSQDWTSGRQPHNYIHNNPTIAGEDEQWRMKPEDVERHRRRMKAFKRIHMLPADTGSPFPGRPLVFLEIGTGNGEPLGTIIIELFNDITPRTAETFRALCTGEKSVGRSRKPLCYKGSLFHQVIKDHSLECGDITDFDGVGGESIYDWFEDTKMGVKLRRRFLVAVVIPGLVTYNAKFIITIRSHPYVGTEHRVVGQVVAGRHVVRAIGDMPTIDLKPTVDCVVTGLLDVFRFMV